MAVQNFTTQFTPAVAGFTLSNMTITNGAVGTVVGLLTAVFNDPTVMTVAVSLGGPDAAKFSLSSATLTPSASACNLQVAQAISASGTFSISALGTTP
jgi:hypothetical protein